MSSIDAPSQGPGTNTGHGHVWKRPDRAVARCGGPGLCKRCKADQEEFTRDQSPLVIEHGDRIEVTWPNGRGRDFTTTPEVVEGWAEQINHMRADRDRLRAALRGIADVTNDEHVEPTTIARQALSASPESCPESPGGKPCAATELAASINGPVGLECQHCGWAWGTRAAPPEPHPTQRDLDRMEGP